VIQRQTGINRNLYLGAAHRLNQGHVREHHPRYRQPNMRKLYEAVRALKQSPQRGRIGREEGTRELLFSPPALPRCLSCHCEKRRSPENLSCRAGSGLALARATRLPPKQKRSPESSALGAGLCLVRARDVDQTRQPTSMLGRFCGPAP